MAEEKKNACKDCEERRKGMSDVLLLLGQLVNKTECLPDLTDKVNWTFAELRGNGKTRFEKFEDVDKEHEENLKKTNEMMQKGFADTIKKVEELIKPISEQVNKNKNSIFKITTTVIIALAMLGGAIVWIDRTANAAKKLKEAQEIIIDRAGGN